MDAKKCDGQKWYPIPENHDYHALTRFCPVLLSFSQWSSHSSFAFLWDSGFLWVQISTLSVNRICMFHSGGTNINILESKGRGRRKFLPFLCWSCQIFELILTHWKLFIYLSLFFLGGGGIQGVGKKKQRGRQMFPCSTATAFQGGCRKLCVYSTATDMSIACTILKQLHMGTMIPIAIFSGTLISVMMIKVWDFLSI